MINVTAIVLAKLKSRNNACCVEPPFDDVAVDDDDDDDNNDEDGVVIVVACDLDGDAGGDDDEEDESIIFSIPSDFVPLIYKYKQSSDGGWYHWLYYCTFQFPKLSAGTNFSWTPSKLPTPAWHASS